jgi:hypothetical protein
MTVTEAVQPVQAIGPTPKPEYPILIAKAPGKIKLRIKSGEEWFNVHPDKEAFKNRIPDGKPVSVSFRGDAISAISEVDPETGLWVKPTPTSRGERNSEKLDHERIKNLFILDECVLKAAVDMIKISCEHNLTNAEIDARWKKVIEMMISGSNAIKEHVK